MVEHPDGSPDVAEGAPVGGAPTPADRGAPASGATPASGDSLPEAAGRRLGAGAWSSGLSVADFASCLAMGMAPVGYVQGYAVMQWNWYASAYYQTAVAGLAGRMPGPAARGQYAEGWQCPHGFVGAEHRMYGFNREQAWVEAGWSQGWGLAYGRMLEEAVSLGAHGVIGVVDDMHQLVGSSTAEFQIRGTAVTVPGAEPPPQPFTTFLSGQRLTKLVEAGFVPVSVAAAMSSVQMVGYCITHYQLAGTTPGNWSGAMSGGVGGVHSIVQVGKAQRAARHLAREQVRRQLAGDVLHGATLEHSEREIGEGDLAVQCTIRGTRVRRYKDFDPIPEPQPVVRLA